MRKHSALLLILFFFLSSCMTYYQRTRKFNFEFERDELKAAEQFLINDKKAPRNNTELLFYLNRGLVSFLLGDYEQSNTHFEKAYFIAGDYRKNKLKVAASFLTNPKITKYAGENFEILYINYYKALNYIHLNNYEAALVEVRRMENQLNELNDKYKSNNKFKRDAFIHLLMGLVYDANKDPNNAFIAYRNAYRIYNEDYLPRFGIAPPEQLKKDLVRTARVSGLDYEYREYVKEFGEKFISDSGHDGDLIFLWHNGLGPVKDEFSVTFTLLRGTAGNITFSNAKYGWSFTFPDPKDAEGNSKFGDLSVVRIALPKYVERPPVYDRAEIMINDTRFPLEMGENVTKIAFQSLEDRILAEIGQSLLRLAAKKAAEYAFREQNEGVGAAISILNAVTEQADTRGWQTLPHSIHYTRVPLKDGENKFKLVTYQTSQIKKDFDFSVEGKKGRTQFRVFRTQDTKPEASYFSQY